VRHFFTSPPAGDAQAWLDGFRTRFPDVGVPARVTWSLRPVEAWDTQWQRHFAPLAVGRRLLVCPPWDDGGGLDAATGGSPPQRLRIVIEPGQGFGTGRHASTALALTLLEGLLEREAAAPPAPPRALPERLLDVGTGSGILLIVGRLLGVREGWALDVDARVGPEVRHNLRLSRLPLDVRLVIGTPAALHGQFPLVLANLTAPLLLEHAADLRRLTSPGGHLILSGMLVPEVQSVLDAIAGPGWERVSRAAADGWAAIGLKCPASALERPAAIPDRP
jgi:ribosomal protein L11 methyltransferase